MTVRRVAMAWLAAMVVWGCGAGEPAPGEGGGVAAGDVGSTGSARGDGVAGARDGGAAPGADPGLGSDAGAPGADAFPVRRWTAGGTAEIVAHLPGDTDLDALDASAVGAGGFAIWRIRGDAGDYIAHQPWLVRPGGDGIELGGEDVYLNAVLRWIPGRDAIALNHGPRVRLLDPSGQVLREFPAHADPGYGILDLAVHPTDGRIALALAHQDGWGVAGYQRALDLAVFDAEGRRLAAVAGFTHPASSDGFLRAPDLHWLPDGRVAFLSTSDDAPPSTTESGGGRWLALVDPAHGRIETTSVATDGIVGVGPDGRIILVEGQLYDPTSGELRDVEIPGMTLIAVGGLSRDGAWLAAAARSDDGEERIGVLRLADGTWRPLGTGTLIGWAPEGGLFWVEGRDRP